MSDRDLIDAVAQKTGEDSHEIRRRGFMLTGPSGVNCGSTARSRRSSVVSAVWPASMEETSFYHQGSPAKGRLIPPRRPTIRTFGMRRGVTSGADTAVTSTATTCQPGNGIQRVLIDSYFLSSSSIAQPRRRPVSRYVSALRL